MSDNFNIRDFRSSAEPEKKSDGKFWTLVIALPVAAAVAGFGYQPMMKLRNGNVDAMVKTQQVAEQNFRVENPGLALLSDMRSDKIIDSSVLISGSSSNRAAQNPYKNKSMNADEFLKMADAKAQGFTPQDLETLKYKRASWALRSCGHTDLRTFYLRQNEKKYNRLKDAEAQAKLAKAEKLDGTASALALPDIENKTQALAFVASGGVRRHQEASMNAFAGLAGLGADSEKYAIRSRRQRFNKKGCLRVRAIVQSGSMHLK